MSVLNRFGPRTFEGLVGDDVSFKVSSLPVDHHTGNHVVELTDQEFITGDQAVNLAVVGANPSAARLVMAIRSYGDSTPRIQVIGIYDTNPEMPGLAFARQVGLFTTASLEALLSRPGLNTVADLSGDPDMERKIRMALPKNITYLDGRASNFLLQLVRSRLDLAKSHHEQNETRQTLKKMKVIIDSLPYRVMVVDADMNIDMVNRTFLKDFRLEWESVLGRKCYEVRHGYDRPCDKMGQSCHLHETFQNKKVFSTIIENSGQGGRVGYEVVTVAPIFDEKDQVVHHLEASRDVTERIRLEQEARKTSIFLQNVIQSAVDGIVVVDTKGRVLLFNEGMERLTGLSAEKLGAHGHVSMFYSMEQARENMRRMRSDQYGPPGKLNPTSMTITNVRGEQIPVTLSASIVTVEGVEVGSVGVFTDMRELFEMRKELSQAHIQLVQSEKIASVGRMAAGVAHEINNPLSIIMIHAELLEETLVDDPVMAADIKEVINQTLRCKEIVSNLLEFSRKSIGEAAPLSLNRLLERCLGLLTRLALFHDIEVVRDIIPEMPEMIGDVGQLEQVFTNLFTNAADAMEGQGRLTVKARFDAEADAFNISVTDTGPGIPKKHRGNVFDIFFTTKVVGKGTGLGLSISKNIIELHGGSIRFECPEGGGTIFYLTLPRKAMTPTDPDPVFVGLDDYEQ